MAISDTILEVFDPARPLKNVSLAGLSSLAPEAQPLLASRAGAAPVDRRLTVVRRLVELGEDDATLDFSGVFTTLLSDPDAEVRRTAVEGLWEYEERELIAPLIGLMERDADDGVRAAAAISLGRYVVLNEFDALRRRDAEAVLGSLRRIVTDPEQPLEVRGRALESIGASSLEWVTDLIWDAYDSGERRLQISALHAMGRNGDPRWLATLYDEMQNDDAERRFEAAGAAGQIGDEDAVPQLTDLFDDPDQEVQEAAIAAVGEIGGELAIEALRERLGDDDERVADAVRAALAEAQGQDTLLSGATPVPGLDLLGEDDEDDEDGFDEIEDLGD